MNKDTFLKKFKTAEKNKQVNWESLYREAMELFCPQRENFYNNISGEKKGRQVYTAHPYIALDKASNNMHATLTPHMKKWVNLKAGRNIPEEEKEKAQESLQEITQTFFDHVFASNFDLAVSEFYKDITIGTGAMLVTGTAKEPLMFTCVPLNELYIITGALGTVDTVFRKYKIACGVIKDTWDDATIPDDLKALIADNPDKEIEIIEGTVPKKYMSYDIKQEKEVEVEGFGYYVCCQKFDGYIVERNMPVNPWIVARWSVMSGEIWGRGPAVISLQDAKTLNQFIKLHMQSMELTVHPMYTIVDDGVINIQNIRIGPGVMIPVSANDGAFGATIAPLRSGGNFQAGQMEISRLESSINDQLYTEPLGAITAPVKTATEISIRQQELSKRIGSAFGRLQYEFIKPLINACLYQLDRLQIINMNDFKVDGHNISIEAISPLAQGQAQDEINNVIRYVEFAMGAFGPEVALTLMKPDEIMNFIGNHLNIPTDIKISEEEKKQAMEVLQNMSMQQEAQGGQEVQQQ